MLSHAACGDEAAGVVRVGPHGSSAASNAGGASVSVQPRNLESVLGALSPRIRDIAIMRGLGYKLTEIARHMGLTPQGVSILLQRHTRRIKELGVRTEHWSLSTRAANALGRLGVSTREQARAINVAHKLRGQRNCGEKTIDEIERWLSQETGESAR